MSGDTIRVFHYQGGSSDKIWAINTVVRADGKYNVWYGRRGNTLTHDTVPASDDAFKRIRQKELKGYSEKPSLTVDTSTRKIVHRSEPQPEPEPEKPSGSWWFTIPTHVDHNLVGHRFEEAIDNLTELDPEEAAYLRGTPAFKAIQNGERQGEIKFSTGPMALLLVHGLRRFLLNAGGGEILLADDDGGMVFGDFERLGPSITAANGEYLESGNGKKEHYLSLKAIKPYAIALGSMDAPINLSVIKTDTAAAFF